MPPGEETLAGHRVPQVTINIPQRASEEDEDTLLFYPGGSSRYFHDFKNNYPVWLMYHIIFLRSYTNASDVALTVEKCAQVIDDVLPIPERLRNYEQRHALRISIRDDVFHRFPFFRRAQAVNGEEAYIYDSKISDLENSRASLERSAFVMQVTMLYIAQHLAEFKANPTVHNELCEQSSPAQVPCIVMVPPRPPPAVNFLAPYDLVAANTMHVCPAPKTPITVLTHAAHGKNCRICESGGVGLAYDSCNFRCACAGAPAISSSTYSIDAPHVPRGQSLPNECTLVPPDGVSQDSQWKSANLPLATQSHSGSTAEIAEHALSSFSPQESGRHLRRNDQIAAQKSSQSSVITNKENRTCSKQQRSSSARSGSSALSVAYWPLQIKKNTGTAPSSREATSVVSPFRADGQDEQNTFTSQLPLSADMASEPPLIQRQINHHAGAIQLDRLPLVYANPSMPCKRKDNTGEPPVGTHSTGEPDDRGDFQTRSSAAQAIREQSGMCSTNISTSTGDATASSGAEIASFAGGELECAPSMLSFKFGRKHRTAPSGSQGNQTCLENRAIVPVVAEPRAQDLEYQSCEAINTHPSTTASITDQLHFSENRDQSPGDSPVASFDGAGHKILNPKSTPLAQNLFDDLLGRASTAVAQLPVKTTSISRVGSTVSGRSMMPRPEGPCATEPRTKLKKRKADTLWVQDPSIPVKVVKLRKVVERPLPIVAPSGMVATSGGTTQSEESLRQTSPQNLSGRHARS